MQINTYCLYDSAYPVAATLSNIERELFYFRFERLKLSCETGNLPLLTDHHLPGFGEAILGSAREPPQD